MQDKKQDQKEFYNFFVTIKNVFEGSDRPSKKILYVVRNGNRCEYGDIINTHNRSTGHQFFYEPSDNIYTLIHQALLKQYQERIIRQGVQHSQGGNYELWLTIDDVVTIIFMGRMEKDQEWIRTQSFNQESPKRDQTASDEMFPKEKRNQFLFNRTNRGMNRYDS